MMTRKKGISIKKDADKVTRLHISLDPLHYRMFEYEFSVRKKANKKTSQSMVICAALEALSQSNSFLERKKEEKRLFAIQQSNITDQIELIDTHIEVYLNKKKEQQDALRKDIFDSRAI